jgi:hypothetical protein
VLEIYRKQAQRIWHAYINFLDKSKCNKLGQIYTRASFIKFKSRVEFHVSVSWNKL